MYLKEFQLYYFKEEGLSPYLKYVNPSLSLFYIFGGEVVTCKLHICYFLRLSVLSQSLYKLYVSSIVVILLYIKVLHI